MFVFFLFVQLLVFSRWDIARHVDGSFLRSLLKLSLLSEENEGLAPIGRPGEDLAIEGSSIAEKLSEKGPDSLKAPLSVRELVLRDIEWEVRRQRLVNLFILFFNSFFRFSLFIFFLF